MTFKVRNGSLQSEKRVLILLSGSLLRWPAEDGPFARVICADGGVRHALAHGIRPDLVVGDFDTVSEEEIDAHDLLNGAERRRYPMDKDATDGELAVDAALEVGASQVVIAGGLGGRLDHTLGNLALLVRVDEAVHGIGGRDEPPTGRSDDTTRPTKRLGVPADDVADISPLPSAWVTDGEERAYLLRGGRRSDGGDGRLVVSGAAGDRLSVLPITERLSGLSIRGVRWPLDWATVRLGESRTVSNEFAGRQAELCLAEGMAWVVTGPRGEDGV